MRTVPIQLLWGHWLAHWIGIRHGLTGLWAAQADRFGLWVPGCLGLGIGLFFALLRDPPVWLLAGPGVGLLVLLLTRRAETWIILSLRALFFVSCGFASAQTHSLLTAPVGLAWPLPAQWYEAEVVAVGRTDAGHRLTLAEITRAGAVVPEVGAGRVRLSLRAGAVPPVGARVRVRAVLNPVPPPLVPGGFDSRLAQYFQGIVGHGTIYGLEVQPGAAPTQLTEWRQALAARIRGTVPGVAGEIAIALAIGDQSGIAAPVRVAMRDSGLTHILSISGLHIGLVAALAMVITRRGLALVPAIALRLDTKKLAVWPTALLVVLYGVLAGWDVPVQRSVIMTGVVLFAILLDRTPLTLRTVAVAAVLVLLGSPEALLNPGFQMSFAAVVALIAGYEGIGPWLSRMRAAYGGVLVPVIAVGSALLTSLVATLATAPFTAFHFHTIALYGIFANLLAIPLTGLVIMPGVVLGFLLLPFGADGWGWALAGWGIEGLTALAVLIAALPGASIPVPAFSETVLLLIVVAGLWACLWSGPLRWGAFAPLGLALVLAGLAPKPLLLVGGTEATLAVPRADGVVEIFGATPESLPARALGEALAAKAVIAMGGEGSLATCDPWGCRFPTERGPLAFTRHPAALAQDCREVWGLIASAPVRTPCPAPAWVHARTQFKRLSPLRVDLIDGKPHLATTQQTGRRWMPPAPERRASKP
ncbi:MAG: ComEC/Rec2 family competence protein [Elstera sp.]